MESEEDRQKELGIVCAINRPYYKTETKNKVSIKMRPGVPCYFEFLVQNQTENDWVADGKVICLQPYINEQGRKCDLALQKSEQCTLGFEITIPNTNTSKKIKVQMCFHSE